MYPWTTKNWSNSVRHPHLHPYLGIFRRILQTCNTRHIFTILLISQKKTDRIFTIFLSQIHLGAKKSPLNFAIHPDSESGPDWPLQRSARSGCLLSLFSANFVLLVQNVPRLLMRLSNHYSSYAPPFKVAEALMALSSNLTQLLTCLLNI